MNSTPNSKSATAPQALSKEDRKTAAAMVRLSLGICQLTNEEHPVQDLRNNPFVSEIRAFVHRHGLQPDVEEFGARGADADILARIRPLYT